MDAHAAQGDVPLLPPAGGLEERERCRAERPSRTISGAIAQEQGGVNIEGLRKAVVEGSERAKEILERHSKRRQ